jgi:anaerobic selenocysteine-containing dehydrogenase
MLDRNPMKRSPGSLRAGDQQVRAICRECTVGCGLLVSIEGGRIVDVQGDEDHPINRGRLCARGTAFVQGLTLPERLASPALRKKKGGALEPLEDWKGAMDLLAEQLRQMKDQHGPDSLLIGCDAEGGLDFFLGAVRFAELWGTSQVFHSAGRTLDPWLDGLDSPTSPCTDWVHAKCLLVVGADLASTRPVAFSQVQEAQRRGAQVVVADARFTATMAKADHAVRMKHGRGNLLGLALTKLMLAEAGVVPRAAKVGFADAWRASFEALSLEGAEETLGISPEKLQHLARLLAKGGPVTVITDRSLAHLPHHRIWRTLAVAMGWAGQPGGGWYPVEAGAPPLEDLVAPSPARASAEPLPPRSRPSTWRRSSLDLKAVICSGNSLVDYLSPFGLMTKQVDLIAHFGAFPNATWEQASLSFPATLWAERDCLAFDDDRSVQWGGKLVEPPAGCRSGLDFWMELARRFGWEAHFPWATEDGRADHAAFYTWLLAQSPLTAGLQLEELRSLQPGARIFWPAAGGALPDQIAPYAAPPTLAADPEAGTTAEYPLSFLPAESSSRSGDASRFWPWTRNLVREDAIQIHPETARLLGIENGEEVLVETPRGALPARASLTRTVPPSAIASFRKVNGGTSALVHKMDQLPDDARNLLKKLTP